MQSRQEIPSLEGWPRRESGPGWVPSHDPRPLATAGLGVLLRKDWAVFRNLGRVLRRQSRLKVWFIALFAVGLLAGLYALFLDGFRFLDSLGGAGFMITRRLFAVFYLALGLMLALSSIVTSYATLFRSRETPFLLTHPFRIETLTTYKFIESSLLSSWAFIFIILPFAAAYAWHEKLGVGFCGWTLLYSVPFLVLCSGVGVLVSLVLARWFPRRRFVVVLVLALAVLAVLLVREGGWTADPDKEPAFVLSRIVPGLRAAANPFLPSWWTAEGVMACTQSRWGRGLMLWTVLLSHTWMLTLVVRVVGRRTYLASWRRVTGGSSTARRRAVLLEVVERWGGSVLPRDVRGMVLKDIRTFLRDPAQWSQAVIFFGLLALYFSNIRSFYYDRLPVSWRNLVAFLNVFSVASVQCSLASRFIYPQLSMEGHAFWVLGLSPTRMGRILAAKFWLSLVGMLAVSVGLMLISTKMLGVSPLVRVTAVGVAAAVSVAVCGLSTGLGAVFIDLKSANPMAVVSGFGGTVNLVLSLAFMLAVIMPAGLVFHLSGIGELSPDGFQRGLVLAALWTVGVTTAAVTVPLCLGRRALDNRDY